MSMCNKDSLNQTIFAAFFTLLLVFSMLMVPCFAAPTSGRTKTAKNGQNTQQHTWHNPCGAAKMGKTGNNARHPKAKAIKALRTQFRITLNHFQKNEEKIDSLYSEVKGLNEYNEFHWLPNKYDFNWYVEEVRDITDTSQKKEKLLQGVHTALQTYFVTFKNLKELDLKGQDPHHLFKVRNKVFGDFLNKIRGLLCEAETAINNDDITVPPRIHHIIEGLHSTPDHTQTLIQDWGVLLHYRKFLQNWSCIMNDFLAKKKRNLNKLPKTCKIHLKKRS